MLKASSHEISITSFDKNNEFQMKWEFSIATKSEHAKYDFLLKNTHTYTATFDVWIFAKEKM